MNLTYLTESKEKKLESAGGDKTVADFSSFMKVEKTSDCLDSCPKDKTLLENSLIEDDEELKLKEENPIIDGPYTAPLFPNNPNYVFSKLLVSIPLEIKPLIEPLPQAIETSFKEGIIKTTIIVELPSSEKVEILIEQYDTAPNSFHVSFYGSTQINDLISQKQSLLLTALQKTHPNFAFAISPPFLKAPSFSLPKRTRLGYSPVNRGKSKK